MSDCEQSPWTGEQDLDSCNRCDEDAAVVNIDRELMEWVDCVADCYGESRNTIAHRFLRHGCENYEDILD